MSDATTLYEIFIRYARKDDRPKNKKNKKGARNRMALFWKPGIDVSPLFFGQAGLT